MIRLSDLSGKKVLILGYGKEGHSVHRFLVRTLPDVSISTADQVDGPDYLKKQESADIVIKSPGIVKSLVTKPYTTATNLFFESCRAHIIGVTGTKGKSTTATLLHHILLTAGKTSHLVGNIGNPALDELEKTIGGNDLFVMELSSYQLEDIRYSPHLSLITNLFPEHMDHHGSVGAYYDAKHNILAHMKKDDYYIYNQDIPELVKWKEEIKGKAVAFERDIPVVLSQTKLIGAHNMCNMRAAVTAAHLLGIDNAPIRNALTTFTPLSHRLENIGTYKGITFYDDAISTTPQSTIAALKALPKVNTILLGGQNRGYDFTLLGKEIYESGIEHIVLFPDSGNEIKKSILEASSGKILHILETKSMEEAVEFAYSHTKPGMICLLSTASPSYSLWKNFEEKGNMFTLFVQKYAKT